MVIKNLTMSYGIHTLFSDVTINIPSNCKLGVVGVNGAGKSTFFKIIRKEIEPDEGCVIMDKNARIGYLPQQITDEVPSLDISVFDFLMQGRPIQKLQNELQECYEKIGSLSDLSAINEIYKKIDKLQNKLAYWEYESSETTLLKIVDGMNISSELLFQNLSTLSGGQKSKIAFAKLLYSKPEIMLLDEPTNHLDGQTEEYITNYLKNYKGTIMVISHDTKFLNAVIDKILHIDIVNKNMHLYNGNYDNFIKLKAENDQNIFNLAQKQQKQEDQLRAIVNKYHGSSGKRKKMAQDREKKLAKLLSSKIEVPRNYHFTKFKMEINEESGRLPLKVENLSFKYDKMAPENIINNLSFEINKGEKFLIIGENGIGKSTLLKLIMNTLIPDEGKISFGYKTSIAYYAQEQELLNLEKSVFDNLKNQDSQDQKIRNILGNFLFSGNSIFKKAKVLSPGERSRLSLAKICLTGANLLLLDEPTNHLDPETQEIIADAFNEYDGTMLVVSHNLSFVDKLGIERLLILPSGKIMYYDKEIVKFFEEENE